MSKSLLLLILSNFFLFYGRALCENGSVGFEKSKVEIALRKIGHDLLLQAGDSTSRVLPIEQVDDFTFLIKFDTSFTFEPNILVANIDDVFTQYGLEKNYIVDVLECNNQSVIYGFAIFEEAQKDIVPCRTRIQESRCYYLKVIFKSNNKANYLMVGVPFALLCIPLLLWLFGKKEKKDEELPLIENFIKIGDYLFYPAKNELVLKNSTSSLTFKESKLLEILAKTPNSIIPRDELQKLVWEDDGVIVGRSLDVFISKLRKKLDLDDHISIISEHGKGYGLMIKA